ncbi:hypothetical protein ACHQM5_008026 [Ranunculus cassubicifolius]
MASGASKYLNDLPSRGLFTSSTISSSNPGGIRVYVCQHDKTAPPEEQVIKTNATNILIRALKLKKGKGDSIPKDAKGKTTPTSGKGKRAAESPADGKVAVKRANTTPNSRASKEEGSSSQTPEKEFQCYTVERLRAALKIRGLPTKGKKDDLIARLKDDKVDG